MTQTIAAIIWAIGLVAWAAIRYPYQRHARRIRVVSDSRSLIDRLALAAATAGLAVIPIIYLSTGFPAFANYVFRPWMGWVGLVMELGFLLLFHATHRQLGRNWSVSLEIRDNHKLVTDDLYRFVRHPMYSSFWLWAIAQPFLLPNWFAGLAGLAGVAIFYFARVGKEEEMMRAAFGKEYEAYAARTGRVVPLFKRGD